MSSRSSRGRKKKPDGPKSKSQFGDDAKQEIKQEWVVKKSESPLSSSSSTSPATPLHSHVENHDSFNNSSSGTKGGLSHGTFTPPSEQSADASEKSLKNNSRDRGENYQFWSPGGNLGNSRSQTSHENSYRSGSSSNSQNSHSSVVSGIRYGQTFHERSHSGGKLEIFQNLQLGVENSQNLHIGAPYDICIRRTKDLLVPSLLEKNREIRNEKNRLKEGQKITILRPGMVHLKHYLSLDEQVKITKTCRELGVGPGGFYQPGYSDGAKLSLKMMCLGKNWDPQTSEYSDFRPDDNAKPPLIPEEFSELVLKAIQDSHDHLKKHSNIRNVEKILPSMKPDLCIVNFYTASGRLGLHQDKDESRESLDKGLPVVSFSIGDSAEFVYGDERDIDKANKIDLESGDVLIFGGKSRHVFHGVTTIKKNTASKVLSNETNIRQGRLNLTFRQY